MKKVILMVLVVIFGLSLSANGRPVGLSGSGTAGDPWLVSSFLDLVTLSINNMYWTSGTYIKQTINIDASDSSTLNGGEGLSTIGNSTNKFEGNYDGQGHTISNVLISNSENYQGFFGRTDGATIQHLGLVDIEVTAQHALGGLVGEAVDSSVITNCYTTGTINAANIAGGLIGLLDTSSSIENCYSECDITGVMSLGGLVGKAMVSTTISKSYASGDVNGTSILAGGFIGQAYQLISISECFATGDVVGNDNVGGFIGELYGTNSSNRAEVSNCYATGNATGVTNIGGFNGKTRNSNINNCYSVGIVNGSGDWVGGFTGYHSISTSTNCFWNTSTAGVATSPAATGKTTGELQTLTTYTNSGWDFVDESVNGDDDPWSIDSESNNGYPYLTWAESLFEIPDPICPNVTNLYPGDGTINLEIDDQISWDPIPEVDGWVRKYKLYIGGPSLNIQATTLNEPFMNLFGLIRYSQTMLWTIYPYYEEIGQDNPQQIFPSEFPDYITFTTRAGIAPDQPVAGNPIELVEIQVPAVASGTPPVPTVLDELPNTGYDYQPIAAFSYNFDVAGDYIITVELADANGVAHVYVGGEALAETDWSINGNVISIDYSFEGTKENRGEMDIVITNDDQTLPVELSSFTAIATSNNFAQISWTTASESHLLGYNLYRSENENQEDALRVTATMIQASNSTMGSSYSFTDDEVEMNVTYNYWLQSNDFDGSSEMFGPVSVKISDQEDHDIDNVLLGTQLLGNYPNPFNPETTISYSVAQAQHVTIEVYNVKGQLVRRLLNEQVNKTNTKLNIVWNGKDDDNNDVSSGIYFYKLVTDNYNKTNKMILMK